VTISRVTQEVVQISNPRGLGSGVVFDGNGDIVTNAHVVAGGGPLAVTGSRGRTYHATLVGSFAAADLAVVHAAGASLPAERNVRVHGVLTGPVDNDMTRGLYVPKSSPESVARAIFDGVANGEEGIFPDPMSGTMAESRHSGAAQATERESAAFVK
jgi:trypsin-like peptidase